MIKIIVHIVVTAVVILLLPRVVPGITVDDYMTAFIVAISWGVVTLLIRPILTLLTLPINLITLGLFSFIINASLLLLVASFVEGFAVSGFIAALIGSAILSLASWAVDRLT